ncbi:excisionase family DNA-binding protein [Rhodococcus sp. BP-252]|uniref:helix-turn-helix domain-containing protein n=1 Tax=unclassified Rhodococcus (in: high G+C Gram-positive bacteria) TaxID=192944 RepID=UPI001C9B4F53|nr:excisionase family DNA-binding protein [Rhodococcus sp. BP-320]MBY6417311.1 excisionase family DNA-binding protein [Rhodococcus sp. BP-321]MBY6421904.1 excisionase family DNA-binding protein [Rhodococcus sp. BP-324]MBY6427335.1 excisionase family DNA-binding protein [Rhodococcus sp. BP-323]MBY6432522.1 excisionase family DNA-binding protein [Rhodococcus sp. BP-322]MBY6441332.1 excisionase family DNA-binding protein [Rhodococcus sp. BP-319]MBY6445273.1 excisionase family DNA-binding protein
MTVIKTSEYTRRGKNLVYQSLHTGELRGTQHTRTGGTWLVHRDDLEEWMRRDSTSGPVWQSTPPPATEQELCARNPAYRPLRRRK